MIAEVVHVSKRKKARPYTLAQKSFTAAELAFWEKRYHAKDIEIVPDDDYDDLTEEEKKKYKAIKIDHIVFARKEEKGLHYNLSV